MSKYAAYRAPDAPVPKETWAWNMYGAGVENIGRDGKPERFVVPEPQADQLLVRVDAVGMCYSDVKLIKQGGSHPKLYNRDLANEPTRLGHEAALTVMKVGADLQHQFSPGQRLALQPDIYQQGKSTAYGYTIPGGLIQSSVSEECHDILVRDHEVSGEPSDDPGAVGCLSDLGVELRWIWVVERHAIPRQVGERRVDGGRTGLVHTENLMEAPSGDDRAVGPAPVAQPASSVSANRMSEPE